MASIRCGIGMNIGINIFLRARENFLLKPFLVFNFSISRNFIAQEFQLKFAHSPLLHKSISIYVACIHLTSSTSHLHVFLTSAACLLLCLSFALITFISRIFLYLFKRYEMEMETNNNSNNVLMIYCCALSVPLFLSHSLAHIFLLLNYLLWFSQKSTPLSTKVCQELQESAHSLSNVNLARLSHKYILKE